MVQGKAPETPVLKKNIPSTQSLIPQAQAGESIDTNIAQSAIADINAGMPIEEFDNLYPELSMSKGIFESYAMDINAGMPPEEGKKLYPELFVQSSQPSQPVAQESVLDQFKMKSSTEFGVAE